MRPRPPVERDGRAPAIGDPSVAARAPAVAHQALSGQAPQRGTRATHTDAPRSIAACVHAAGVRRVDQRVGDRTEGPAARRRVPRAAGPRVAGCSCRQPRPVGRTRWPRQRARCTARHRGATRGPRCRTVPARRGRPRWPAPHDGNSAPAGCSRARTTPGARPPVRPPHRPLVSGRGGRRTPRPIVHATDLRLLGHDLGDEHEPGVGRAPGSAGRGRVERASRATRPASPGPPAMNALDLRAAKVLKPSSESSPVLLVLTAQYRSHAVYPQWTLLAGSPNPLHRPQARSFAARLAAARLAKKKAEARRPRDDHRGRASS